MPRNANHNTHLTVFRITETDIDGLIKEEHIRLLVSFFPKVVLKDSPSHSMHAG